LTDLSLNPIRKELKYGFFSNLAFGMLIYTHEYSH